MKKLANAVHKIVQKRSSFTRCYRLLINKISEASDWLLSAHLLVVCWMFYQTLMPYTDPFPIKKNSPESTLYDYFLVEKLYVAE